MAKRAIISDIHGNLAALEAVLEHIDAQEDISDIVCLGDTLGYGPQPVECLLTVMKRCSWSLLGNHDEGVLDKPTNGTTKIAADSMRWSRKMIDHHSEATTMINYLKGCQRTQNEQGGDILFVHGSPLDPTNGYLFDKHIDTDPRLINENFDIISWICFQGHTHQAGVFDRISTDDKHPPDIDFVIPSPDLKPMYFHKDRKTMVNVGSVGQPRDGNLNSSYVTFEPNAKSEENANYNGRFQFVRVPYNLDETCRLIEEIPELDNLLADRLCMGK